jgi:hypothetical protein
MADETTTQNVGKPEGDGEKGKESQVDFAQVIERLKSLETERDAWKKNEQGYQRVVNEQKTKIETLETEKMTEKQRAEYEMQKSRDEIASTKAALARERLELDKIRLMGELKVPQDFAPFVAGKDANEMQVNMTNFMKVFNDAVNKGVQQKLVKSGETQNLTTGEQQQTNSASNLDEWKKVWAMKPGKEKDDAMRKMFESLKGQDINVYTG